MINICLGIGLAIGIGCFGALILTGYFEEGEDDND